MILPADIKPEVLAAEDASCWSEFYKIKLQQGVWTFDDHPFLIEPMQQPMLYRAGIAPRRQCSMKGSQAGFTQLNMQCSLHGMIYGHYPTGVLYLFPTTDDMREFSKSRFAPLIAANPSALGRYIQEASTKTDTASLKRVGDAFLFMRGAGLSQHIEVDAKESAKLRSISVDRIVYDEYDLMDPGVDEMAKSRLGASKVKEQYYLSNPVLPGSGIAQLFEESDQRHWFRKCVRCGKQPSEGADWEWFVAGDSGWTSAEVVFPNCVEQGDDGGYIACEMCGKPLGLKPGVWVPREASNSEYMWGYRWSQLTSATNDPFEILQDYTQTVDKERLARVVRFRLGLPYVNAEDRMTSAQVMGCCGIGQQLNSHHGPCAMGVDVRRHKNVVVGCRTSKNSWRILRVARLESFDDVLAMAYRFNVRIAVVDVRPYEDQARKFQRDSRFQTYLCEYKETAPVGSMFNDNTGLVTVNRTEALDATHRMIRDGQIELPGDCPEVRQFALECAATAKVEEINRRTGRPTFRYRKLGTAPDDYRHALAYFVLAATSTHLPVVGGGGRGSGRARYAKNEYARWG